MTFRETDKLLIVSTLMLITAGVVMVHSTSYVMAMKRFGDEYFFVKKHLFFSGAALLAFVAASRIPTKLYRSLVYPILGLTVLLLALVYVQGVGFEAGGARRWVRIGGFAFQPSEPAKLAVVIFMAYSLSAKAEVIKSFSAGFLPNVVIPGVVILLILFQTDLGTAATIALVVFIMSFIGGVRYRYLAGLATAAAAGLYGVIQNFGYMQDRIEVFLDPWKDPFGKGFQIVQSFVAFGSGGVTGVGLGEGRQKLFYLPEAHTDFILSVIGEELGLLGVGSVIFLYAVFLVCGVRVALGAKDLHARYLAAGITVMITLQAALNMAITTGLMPPKGLPLPFISYGGTSLVVNAFAAGILLNIYIRENQG